MASATSIFNGVSLQELTSTQRHHINGGAIPEAESSMEVVNEVVDTTPRKTKEELMNERTAKRAQKKQTIHEKAEAHRKAGDVLYQAKNYKAAYPQYQEAIQLLGNVPEYYISLAAAYRKLTWYEEAAHAATRALTIDPKNLEARYVRGVARLEQRLLKPAQTDFNTLLEHDPSHLRALAALTEVNQILAQSGSDAVDAGNNDIGVDFSFPQWDYEALEVASVSDSSDCHHVGNGVPCRFYNHEGCTRGAECAYSHAPDEKSVRDDLGKNVCIYHLLDSCKFGIGKCVYSHSKDALPKRGWWNSPEKVAKVKAVLEVAEKNAREQRQLENQRWKAHLKDLKGALPRSSGKKAPQKEKVEETVEEQGEDPNAETKEQAKAAAPSAPPAAEVKEGAEKVEKVPENKGGATKKKTRRYYGKRNNKKTDGTTPATNGTATS